MKHTLSNPYSRDAIGPGEELWKTSIWLSSTDSEFLNSLADRGWLQATVGHLLKKLIHELKRNKLDSYDPDRYAAIIEQCQLKLDLRVGPRTRKSKSAGADSPRPDGPVEQAPSGDV